MGTGEDKFIEKRLIIGAVVWGKTVYCGEAEVL